ncbi:MAG: hypothetical protein AB1488_05710 [Nitrospirota bacterium]
MLFWDRIRKSIIDASGSIKEYAKLIAERLTIEVGVFKLSQKKGRIQRKITAAYQKIGERIYILTEQKEKNILKDADVTAWIEEIKSLRLELERLQKEIQLITTYKVNDS